MRMYRVCGNHEVLGHRPGDKFSADLTETQEQRLVAGGHIERDVKVDRRALPDGMSALEAVREAADEEFPHEDDDLPDDRAGDPDQKE